MIKLILIIVTLLALAGCTSTLEKIVNGIPDGNATFIFRQSVPPYQVEFSKQTTVLTP